MVRLTINTLQIAQTHYKLILEQYEAETFSYDEEITDADKGSDSMKSNVIFLAEPLIKSGVAI